MDFQNNYSVEAVTSRSRLLRRECFKRLVHVWLIHKQRKNLHHRYHLFSLRYHYPVFAVISSVIYVVAIEPRLQISEGLIFWSLIRPFSFRHRSAVDFSTDDIQSHISCSQFQRREFEASIDQSGFDTMTAGNKWENNILYVPKRYIFYNFHTF